jgi:hypothetical protein
MSALCTVRVRLERLKSAITNAHKQLHYLPTRAETHPETPEGPHLHTIIATVPISVKRLIFFVYHEGICGSGGTVPLILNLCHGTY